jgi:hypothetical protein
MIPLSAKPISEVARHIFVVYILAQSAKFNENSAINNL